MQTKKNNSKKENEIGLTAKSLIAFEYFFNIDAVACARNVPFSVAFDEWKNDFKKNPKIVKEKTVRSMCQKNIDSVTSDMLVSEYNHIIDKTSGEFAMDSQKENLLFY